MRKRLRIVQPPHPSDRVTLEQAIAAWRQVEGRSGPAEPETGRRVVPGRAQPRVSRGDGARVAADRQSASRRTGTSGDAT
jgi:hypothetical protein